MTDLITRLREESAAAFADDYPGTADLLCEAAATITELVDVLERADRAIAEYQRYFFGGEMRGSYDGKPERTALWQAGDRTRQALARVRTQETTI